jgi:hypothetical protein
MVRKVSSPIPRTVAGWFKEIKLAIADAREAKAFGPLIGEPITDANLFHLAPLVCLKFRGRKLVGREASRKRHWRIMSSTPIRRAWITVLNRNRCWRLLSVT